MAAVGERVKLRRNNGKRLRKRLQKERKRNAQFALMNYAERRKRDYFY